MSLTVTAIEWLSREAKEAVLRVSDGSLEAFIFCHPCVLQEGDALTGPLLAFDSQDAQLITTREPLFRPIGDTLGCQVQGRVQDTRKQLVRIGEFCVELDTPLPGDANDGDWVRFKCERLDYLG